jgi:hypothetical protein
MEISSTTLYNREQTLNRGNIGQDLVQKPQENQEEIQQLQQADKPEEVRKPEADKQGRLDIYA